MGTVPTHGQAGFHVRSACATMGPEEVRVSQRPSHPGAIWTVAVLVLAACNSGQRAPERVVPASRPGPVVTMAELHMEGGVPPRWKLTPPPGDPAAGRRAFEALGCPSCHVVQGEPFSRPTTSGPELSGMGTHHPPAYFVESILNPDAVLVDGPGYIGPDGHSTMPVYPDMTLAQLADVVAYVASLTDGGQHYVETEKPRSGPSALAPLPELPPPPSSDAHSYFVQMYEVNPGMLAEFEDWFRREGAAQFRSVEGLVSVDTWVSTLGDGPPVITVLSFRDDAARVRFLADPLTDPLGRQFDSFIGPHSHLSFVRPPLYRAPSLSSP